MKNNTIGKLVKNLKAFLNDRMPRNRIKPIDLTAFKVVQEEVDHIYLTATRYRPLLPLIVKMMKSWKRVKDFFVLGSLTGLGFLIFQGSA